MPVINALGNVVSWKCNSSAGIFRGVYFNGTPQRSHIRRNRTVLSEMFQLEGIHSFKQLKERFTPSDHLELLC